MVAHHELGHLYYDLYYKDLPFAFRNAANDGFHEAIGDAIALSCTPEYFRRIGLSPPSPNPDPDTFIQKYLQHAIGFLSRRFVNVSRVKVSTAPVTLFYFSSPVICNN